MLFEAVKAELRLGGVGGSDRVTEVKVKTVPIKAGANQTMFMTSTAINGDKA